MSAILALPWAPLCSAAQLRPAAQQSQAQPSAALGLRPLLPGCRRCCRWRPAPPLLAPAAAAAASAAGADGELRPQVEADSIIDPDGTVRLQPQSEEDRKDLWRRAIKLPMYSVGWAPILVRPGECAVPLSKAAACRVGSLLFDLQHCSANVHGAWLLTTSLLPILPCRRLTPLLQLPVPPCLPCRVGQCSSSIRPNRGF